MTMNRIFLYFSVVLGAAIGVVIVLVPQSRTLSLAPYFWVLIAFALFEGVVVLRRGMAGGAPISATTRIIGFAMALALMYLIPMAAGVEMSIFGAPGA
jgi:hypothetical protein